jgi:hypothetical protein
MVINSVCAIFILVIEVFNLMTECQEPFGLYCSQIHKLVAIQYYKIIFGEFFSFFFQLISNFTYVAFSLNRLSLIGDKHGSITLCVSEIAIECFLIISSIVTLILSLVKCFRYEVNYFVTNHDYPFTFQNNPFYNPSQTITGLIFITNGIVDFINYVLFILVNLILDIILAQKLRKTLREKREKFKSDAKKEKEDEEAVNRLIHMAIFYALTNLIFKLPNSITSLNDLVIISTNLNEYGIKFFRSFYENDVNIRYFDFIYFMKYVCSVTKICQVFHKYANLFYLLSFSFNILFFYNFDKKFQTAFNLVFCMKNNLNTKTATNAKTPTKQQPNK